MTEQTDNAAEPTPWWLAPQGVIPGIDAEIAAAYERAAQAEERAA